MRVITSVFLLINGLGLIQATLPQEVFNAVEQEFKRQGSLEAQSPISLLQFNYLVENDSNEKPFLVAVLEQDEHYSFFPWEELRTWWKKVQKQEYKNPLSNLPIERFMLFKLIDNRHREDRQAFPFEHFKTVMKNHIYQVVHRETIDLLSGHPPKAAPRTDRLSHNERRTLLQMASRRNMMFDEFTHFLNRRNNHPN